MTEYTVSVIIPTYNGIQTIRETLESVLRQNYKNYEIIIVDDGSTDSTVETVRQVVPNARVTQQHNQGTLAARQTGLTLAQGDLIAFLDQDDIWHEEALQTEVDVLRERPEIGLVLANMQAIDQNGNQLGFNVVPEPQCHTPRWEDLLIFHPIANSVALFRKEAVDKIGDLDVRFGFSGALGDTDTFLRMSEVTKFHFIDQCLGLYRWSETRPGRLISFLDNLQVYARKYWGHPRLMDQKNLPLRKKFVLACCNYAIHIYRLLLKEYNYKVPAELLARLSTHNQTMENLFGDLYRELVQLTHLDLNLINSVSEADKTLLFLFLLRSDLQHAYPEVGDGNLLRLREWGATVSNGLRLDQDFTVLEQFKSELAPAPTAGQTRSHKILDLVTVRNKLYWKLFFLANRLFPAGTQRRHVLKPILKGANVLLTEGWVSFGRRSISFMGRQIHTVENAVKEKFRGTFSHFSKPENLDKDSITKSKLRVLLSDMGAKFAFPKFDSPVVAMVVSADENQHYTYECIESLAAHSRIPYRLFVIRNKAVPEEQDFLTKLDNVIVLDHTMGHNDNDGLHDLLFNHLESEKYILFIKGDTVVTGGYLDQMMYILQNDDSCGAVASKLVDISGHLLEAGGIIDNQGNFVSYGSGDNPDMPEYSYVRQIQFGSPNCFLVRRSVLGAICSTSQCIPPGVDGCKRITESGYTIKYQPAAIVLSHNSGQLDLQESRSLPKKNDPAFLTVRDVKKSTKILVIDDYIPAIRYGSGFPRLYKMITCLSDLGYLATFFPVGNPVKVQPETSELQQKGIEVFWGNQATFEEFAESRAGYYDVVLISRPHVFERMYPIVIRSWPKAAILYDAEALFYARDIVKAEITGATLKESEKTSIARKEMQLVEKADVVISVSQQTKEIMLKNSSQRNIDVWEHIQDVPGSEVSFEQRQGLMHFGSFFAGPGSPNEDAVLYFVQEVLPEIKHALSCTLYVVGTSPTAAIKELAGQDIEVVGYVEHPKTYFNKCRVNIVPTRIFATGTPLKLIEAMSYGIPTVVNGPIARHLGLVDGKEVLVADTSREFAIKVIQLYSDATLWQSLHQNSIKYITENYSYDKMKHRLGAAIQKGLEIRSSRA